MHCRLFLLIIKNNNNNDDVDGGVYDDTMNSDGVNVRDGNSNHYCLPLAWWPDLDSRDVANSWKVIDKISREALEVQAAIEKDEYSRKSQAWKLRQQEQNERGLSKSGTFNENLLINHRRQT